MASTNIRIYLDLEYCFPGMKKGPRPTHKDTRQVVQIAAIMYDNNTGEELAHFERLARPKYTSQVNDFFEELTGITQSEIDARAIEFPIALEEFAHFYQNYPVWTFDKDQEVLQQNCKYFDIPLPFQQSFTRVKPLLSGWGIDADAYSSGTLYKAASLKMDGHVHNALHDVRSMAAAVRVLETAISSVN